MPNLHETASRLRVIALRQSIAKAVHSVINGAGDDKVPTYAEIQAALIDEMRYWVGHAIRTDNDEEAGVKSATNEEE